jgi:hypothetical protein
MYARVKIDVSEFCEVLYLLDIPVLSTKGLFKKIVWSGRQATFKFLRLVTLKWAITLSPAGCTAHMLEYH